MFNRNHGSTRTLIAVAACVLLAAAGSVALASECYTAEIDVPMVLPDGSTAAGGQVRVCRVKQLTPASTLHSLSIGGRDAGMFLGSRQTVEIGDDATARPSFLFARTATNSLEFRAVAYLVDGRYQAFRADRIGRRDRVLNRDAFAMAVARDPGSVLVAFAAAD